jgi:Zn-dependent metalloprotease
MKSGQTVLLYYGMFFFFFIIFNSLSAENLHNISGTIFQGAKIQVDDNQNTPLEIRLKQDKRISITAFFDQYKKAFNWSEDNDAVSIREIRDDLGQTHHRFKQRYKGIELADVQYLVHEKEGSVYYAHGKLIHGLSMDITPVLSEAQALQIALEHIAAKSYMWENKKNEALIKKHQNDPGEESIRMIPGQLIIRKVRLKSVPA